MRVVGQGPQVLFQQRGSGGCRAGGRFLDCAAAAVLVGLLLIPRPRWSDRVPPGRQLWMSGQGQPAPPTEVATQATPPKVVLRVGREGWPERTPSRVASTWNALTVALGQAEQRDFSSRLKAIAQLGQNLSHGELLALTAYVLDPSEEEGLYPGQTFALKNDVLNVLREQVQPPSDLTDLLIALWRDSAQPAVMRDYALQHLAAWYDRVDASQRTRIVQTLQSAAAETGRSSAGTALLGLHRLSRAHPDAGLPPIADRILTLLEDPAANLAPRITAAQLSGQLGLREARPALRRLAADATHPPTLRLAAVAALGAAGQPEDLLLLDQVAAEPDPRLQRAAALARERWGRPRGASPAAARSNLLRP